MLKRVESEVGPMRQSVFMYVGAVVGVLVWLAFRKVAPLPNAFICAVLAAWLGIILFGLVRGEITIAGRGRASVKTFIGAKARMVAVALLLLLGIFVIFASDALH